MSVLPVAAYRKSAAKSLVNMAERYLLPVIACYSLNQRDAVAVDAVVQHMHTNVCLAVVLEQRGEHYSGLHDVAAVGRAYDIHTYCHIHYYIIITHIAC